MSLCPYVSTIQPHQPLASSDMPSSFVPNDEWFSHVFCAGMLFPQIITWPAPVFLSFIHVSTPKFALLGRPSPTLPLQYPIPYKNYLGPETVIELSIYHYMKLFYLFTNLLFISFIKDIRSLTMRFLPILFMDAPDLL